MDLKVSLYLVEEICTGRDGLLFMVSHTLGKRLVLYFLDNKNLKLCIVLPFQSLRVYPTVKWPRREPLGGVKWQNHPLTASDIFLPWIIKEYQVIMWLLKYFCMSSQHSVVEWNRMVKLMGTSSWWELLEILSVDTISAHMTVATKTLANAVKWCFWDYYLQHWQQWRFSFLNSLLSSPTIPFDDIFSWFEKA